MDHDAVVAVRPIGRALRLLAYKAVFHGHKVIGESIFVENMAELAVELVVLIVGDLQQTILHTESIAEIIPHFVLRNLYRPTVEILPIEELDPILWIGFGSGVLGEGNTAERENSQNRNA